MRKSTVVVSIIFFILFALHQDSWNWSDRSLLFGFLPVGLAYHAAFSLVVAVYWFLVSRFAWPDHIERWADEVSSDSDGE